MQGLWQEGCRCSAGLSPSRIASALVHPPSMIRFRYRRESRFKDAADCVAKLPAAEQHHPTWQAAIEALILVAESDGPTMFARIGVMRPLNHHKPAPKIAPRLKRAKAYSIVR
jgi:glucose/arabinose dehydrogenase